MTINHAESIRSLTLAALEAVVAPQFSCTRVRHRPMDYCLMKAVTQTVWDFKGMAKIRLFDSIEEAKADPSVLRISEKAQSFYAFDL